MFLYYFCASCSTRYSSYIYSKTSTHLTLMFHKGPSSEARGHIITVDYLKKVEPWEIRRASGPTACQIPG